MDNRKELTRQLIVESFKELMQRKPFEKISISTITEEAGIRRPSFYNHFRINTSFWNTSSPRRSFSPLSLFSCRKGSGRHCAAP